MRVTPALALTAMLSLAALGAAPGQAQTMGDLVGALPPTEYAPVPGQPVGQALFGSTEIMSGSLKALPQWTRVLAEMEAESATFESCARNARNCLTPTLRNWNRVIREAASQDRAGKIRTVNEFFNQWPYKQDREIYGHSEYWAAPAKFMAHSGDCEDYSIAKYFALRALGFEKEELRIVILMDEIRGIGHAVLAVYEKDGIVILDSLSNLILPHERYKHYRPQYSMNETTRWAHLGGFDNKPSAPYQGLVARRDLNEALQ